MPENTLRNDELLTITQAALIIGVSVATIRRRIADGTLPANRFGKRLIRIWRADLDGPMRRLSA